MSRRVAAMLVATTIAGLGAAPVAHAVPTTPFNVVYGDSYYRGNMAWNTKSYTITGTLHTEGCLVVRNACWTTRARVASAISTRS